MELLSVIRRWRYRDHYSIREISRRTKLSRNTVRKYLRSDSVEPKFQAPDRPSKLDPYADKLSQMLRQEAGRPRKQKRTIKQLHVDLVALGYDGSYNRVATEGASAQQLGLSDAERVRGARTDELWKRRLPKEGKLGKRRRTRFPLSHSSGGCYCG